MNNISSRLQVNLTYTPIINFAMQQNHVPVIRKLTIKNIGRIDLTNINIENNTIWSKYSALAVTCVYQNSPIVSGAKIKY